MTWFVYIARCRDGSLYTGVTTDVVRRMATHNAGRGAAYTRVRRPVAPVHVESAPDRGSALRREHAIKQLSRKAKLQMVRESTPREGGGTFTGFDQEALTFFRRLRRRNQRAWDEAHRAEYEAYVRDPLRALVEEMDTRLARLAPEMIGDPRRSVFRPHRDVRFSPDKSPYKTHAAAQFYHRDAGRGAGTDATGAGAAVYFHLDPEQSFVAGGIWMPARPALSAIRDAIAADPAAFEAIVLAAPFRRRFGGLDDEAKLRRMPRGYPDTHPAARWLRYQSFVGYRALSDADVLSPRLAAALERDFARLLPLVRWLNAAIGYAPAARR
ncbi:MAG: TIGR02453 family protein [Gemmatimonadales bacterium]|nr:TIGR02453 family protein [Gemmatimonadales bacterium]